MGGEADYDGKEVMVREPEVSGWMGEGRGGEGSHVADQTRISNDLTLANLAEIRILHFLRRHHPWPPTFGWLPCSVALWMPAATSGMIPFCT